MAATDDRRAEERLTELFNQHSARIRAYARRRVGPDAAQEVVAETFLAAWRHIDGVPDRALPWLYRAASFEVANHRRRIRADAQLDRALVEERIGQSHGRAADATAEDRHAVAAAFAELSPRDRELLRLAGWEQVSATEGAAVLGCSVPAYRVRLHRARQRLERATSRHATAPVPEAPSTATTPRAETGRENRR